MLHIRLMTAADIPFGMALKQQSGWNQLQTDWQRFLMMQPDGCFLAEQDGQPVGTVVTCIFDSVAWIAMMLVEESRRGRGIGRALMEHALRFLEQHLVRTVRLDATAMGAPLYRKLGFVDEYTLVRYAATCQSREAVAGVELVGREQGEELCELDRTATGANRHKMYRQLLAEQPAAIVRTGGRMAGFLLFRPGSQALQIGPCIASKSAQIPPLTRPHIGPCIASAPAGESLFRFAFHRCANQPAFIDIPVGNLPARQLAEKHGFRPHRELLRMYRGQPVIERVDQIWASSGPEKG